jgi:trimethylamine--corrinoid protein Co-methyltransferase
LDLLQGFGIEILHAEALDLAARAGAEVDFATKRVRFPAELVEQLINYAPSSFEVKSRNPHRHLPIGGDRVVYVTVSSAPNSSDLAGGRRTGSFEDFEALVKLADSLNVVHSIGGYPVEPVDLPANTRHLDCLRSILTLTDKVPRAYALGSVRIRDAIEMMKIAHQLGDVRSDDLPSMLITNVSVNSPLRIDGPMLDGLFEMSRANQVVKITPFTLSGAMAPVTLAGALVQQHAEAMAGVALTQLARKGAPVIYGCFISNVDMRSGAPAFGTPEYVRGTLIAGQLARHLKLPLRVSNANASNAVDAQAAYESEMSLWAAILSGGNFVQHACGWLEGGLVASREKMILDAEMLQMLNEVLEPVQVDDVDLAIDAIKEVGPGGHFFGVGHTLERYETAFYKPLLSDWRNFQTWREAGAQEATQRAAEIAAELIREHIPPVMPVECREALNDYVQRRREEIGSAPLD